MLSCSTLFSPTPWVTWIRRVDCKVLCSCSFGSECLRAIIDSGAPVAMCSKKGWLHDVHSGPSRSLSGAFASSGNVVTADFYGTLKLLLPSKELVEVKEVLFVPHLYDNVLIAPAVWTNVSCCLSSVGIHIQSLQGNDLYKSKLSPGPSGRLEFTC